MRRPQTGSVCASSRMMTLPARLWSFWVLPRRFEKRLSNNCTVVVTTIGASQFSAARRCQTASGAGLSSSPALPAHSGQQSVVAYADPQRALGVAYTTDGLQQPDIVIRQTEEIVGLLRDRIPSKAAHSQDPLRPASGAVITFEALYPSVPELSGRLRPWSQLGGASIG